MAMKKIIYKKTQKIRHLIVKLIAPQLWQKTFVPPRPMIKAVKEKFGGKRLAGIEIGVRKGLNAENILSLLNIKKLYLIDPYEPYLDGRKILTSPTDSLSQVKKILAKFNQKTIFILKKSSEAIIDIPDKVDFVYIDGNHAYEFIKDDINRYYDKVKSGGIIGGHDFNPNWFGVYRAVIEFAQKKNLKLNGKKDDWWIIKP